MKSPQGQLWLPPRSQSWAAFSRPPLCPGRSIWPGTRFRSCRRHSSRRSGCHRTWFAQRSRYETTSHSDTWRWHRFWKITRMKKWHYGSCGKLCLRFHLSLFLSCKCSNCRSTWRKEIDLQSTPSFFFGGGGGPLFAGKKTKSLTFWAKKKKRSGFDAILWHLGAKELCGNDGRNFTYIHNQSGRSLTLPCRIEKSFAPPPGWFSLLPAGAQLQHH